MILGFVFGALLATVPGAIYCCRQEMSFDELPETCSINNLTIVSTAIPGKEIVCDSTPMSYTLLTTPPNVYYQSDKPDRNQSEKSALTLVVYDATQNQLLWALSNAKTKNPSIVSQIDATTSILKPYEPVPLDPLKRKHTLVFAIFQRQPEDLAINRSHGASVDLKEWASRLKKSGGKLCDPLAAARVIVDTVPGCPISDKPSAHKASIAMKRQSRSLTKPKAYVSFPNSKSDTAFNRRPLNSLFNSFYAKIDSPSANTTTEMTKTSNNTSKPSDNSSKPSNNSSKPSDNSSKPSNNSSKPWTDEMPGAKSAQANGSKIYYLELSQPPNGNIYLQRVARAAKPAAEEPTPGKGDTTTKKGDKTAGKEETTTGKVAAAGKEETTTGKAETPGKGETTTGSGETTTGKGETTTGKGETTTGKGETTTGKGETTTGKGETTTGKGETTTGKGETTTGKGETTTGKGETTTGKGETTTGKVETTTGVTSTTSKSNQKKNFGVNFQSNSVIIIILVIFSTQGIHFGNM